MKVKVNKCLLIVLPPEVSVVDLACMYGFGVLPKAKTVEIALVYPTPWQLLPEKNKKLRINYNLIIKFEKNKGSLTIIVTIIRLNSLFSSSLSF